MNELPLDSEYDVLGYLAQWVVLVLFNDALLIAGFI